jgi:hypothetical protein
MKIYVALKDAKNKIKIKINNPNQQLPTRNICSSIFSPTKR